MNNIYGTNTYFGIDANLMNKFMYADHIHEHSKLFRIQNDSLQMRLRVVVALYMNAFALCITKGRVRSGNTLFLYIFTKSTHL